MWSLSTRTGTITAVGKGQASVSVRTFNGLSASALITVNAVATSIDIAQSELTLAVGTASQLAISMPEFETDSYRFESSDSNVASVSATASSRPSQRAKRPSRSPRPTAGAIPAKSPCAANPKR